MTSFDLNEDIIYPYESQQMNFWAKKWGIQTSELHEAIIQTGSINRKVIREYLENKGIVFSLSGFMLKLRNRLALFADKFNEEKDYC
jgi:hypothetical protein